MSAPPNRRLAAALVLAATAAQAQPAPTVTVGRITSEKSCKVYQQFAGRSAAIVTPFAMATAESWRTWLVKDCTTNFATMRASLEAALAAAGKFAMKPQGGRYVLTGTVSRVGGDPDAAPQGPNPGDIWSVSSNSIFVSMEVTLKDAAGRIVYGGLLTKKLEVASNIRTERLRSTSSQTGEGIYDELQNQVALAVARLVAFHIVPLRVTAVDGHQVRLNYGAPLLTLGTVVAVTPPGGFRTVRYGVTGSDSQNAVADQDSEGTAGVQPGDIATVIEADDPGVNARRIQRVDLP